MEFASIENVDVDEVYKDQIDTSDKGGDKK